MFSIPQLLGTWWPGSPPMETIKSTYEELQFVRK